jgi:ABC-type sugar transport system permease subunit
LFLLFDIYPIFLSVYFSLFDWNGLGPAVDFVGLENFKNILTDKVFLTALNNVLLIIGFSLGLQLPLALVLAVLVGRHLPGRALFRTIFFMPYVLSEVNTAIMWMLLYNPDPERGFLNAVLTLFPGMKPVAWLGDPDIVLLAVFITLTWKFFGFHMLLYLTGLQNIPTEIEEAARLDGANSFQNFFYITLPLLSSTIALCLSVCTWLDPTVHSGLDHDERGASQCQRDFIDLYVPLRLRAVPTGVRLGGGDLYVPDLPDLFPALPAPDSPARLPDWYLKGMRPCQ